MLNNRYEFVLFFEAVNSNPNGDPDAGNLPRIDPETGCGIVTDVCIKRKIRNYVQISRPQVDGDYSKGEKRFHIYVREGVALNSQHRIAYDTLGLKPESKKLPKKKEEALELTRFMCHNFYDIRTFGAVMTTDVNCGQVRGPVQLAFGRSIDPVLQQEFTITRVAVTKEGAGGTSEKSHEMGRKQVIPYGLYRIEGYISAYLAQQTGFDEDDLSLLWESLINMFEHDRSASRGGMSTRKLFVFKHSSMLGNAPAHVLFDTVTSRLTDDGKPARSFGDYTVSLNKSAVPDSVEAIELL